MPTWRDACSITVCNLISFLSASLFTVSELFLVFVVIYKVRHGHFQHVLTMNVFQIQKELFMLQTSQRGNHLVQLSSFSLCSAHVLKTQKNSLKNQITVAHSLMEN